MIAQQARQAGERWSEYFLVVDDDAHTFWADRLNKSDKPALFILGKGFDPRMPSALALLIDAGFRGTGSSVRAIAYDEGADSPSQRQAQQANENWTRVTELCSGADLDLSVTSIAMRSTDGRLLGPASALEVFEASAQLTPFSDVIVDISALPRALYFPLIAKLLTICDEAKAPLNLHVMVTEHPILDKAIADEGVEETAYYLPGFLGEADMQSTADHPLVWIPLLGPGQYVQLQRIRELVNAREISPLLPSPAINPRTADELLLEYRRFLFDELRIDHRSFVYTSEFNPFEVYRQLCSMILHYRMALAPLGGSKAVVSVHSTKLMSLGALLATYDLKQSGVHVGVADVASHGYTLADADERERPPGRVFSMWLAGEAYAD